MSNMARFSLPFVTVFSFLLSVVNASECPSVGGKDSFDCPRPGDLYDWKYCCNQGQIDQFCCRSNDHNDKMSWGSITLLTFGSLIGLFVLLTIVFIICVFCLRRRTLPPPLLTHSQAVQSQQYKYGAASALPAFDEAVAQPHFSKPGDYGQYYNEATQPIN